MNNTLEALCVHPIKTTETSGFAQIHSSMAGAFVMLSPISDRCFLVFLPLVGESLFLACSCSSWFQLEDLGHLGCSGVSRASWLGGFWAFSKWALFHSFRSIIAVPPVMFSAGICGVNSEGGMTFSFLILSGGHFYSIFFKNGWPCIFVKLEFRLVRFIPDHSEGPAQV